MNLDWTRPRHAIRNRLLAGIGALIVLAVIAGTSTSVATTLTTQDFRTATAKLHDLMDQQMALALAIEVQHGESHELQLGGSSGDRDEYLAAIESEHEVTFELASLSATDPALSDAIHRVGDATGAWRTWVDGVIGSDPGAIARRSDAATVADGERLEDAIARALGHLDEVVIARREASFAVMDASSRSVIILTMAVAATFTVVLAAVGWWFLARISRPLDRLSLGVTRMTAGQTVAFEAERDDEIGALASAIGGLRSELDDRYEDATAEVARAGVYARLEELTSFARDEDDLVAAAIAALGRLVPSDRGDVMFLNPSMNRLTIGGTWGVPDLVPGATVDLDQPDRCPGMRRAAAHVIGDLSDSLALRCPAHVASTGSLACVPMPALGQLVGVIHLARSAVDAFSPQDLLDATRVAERVALAVANARLLRTMEGLAMTDGMTGLHNARFFDPYLEHELAAAERDGQAVGVIMLDLDHFKAFNDRYGHPAGDEALKTLARTLRAAVRESDTVARYGGEEFIIALRGAGLEESRRVAEKVRKAIEQLVVELGPGRFARITASLGVAATDVHPVDRLSLVRLADSALYVAKEAGRNRVEVAGPPSSDSATSEQDPTTQPTSRSEHRGPRLMPEVARPGDEHRRAGGIGGGDDLGIAD